MEQDSLNDWTNGLSAIGASFRYFQFSAADAVRRMQGDILALLGLGRVESYYRLIASGSYWRLRDYGSAH